jgi:hypothetical protein
MFLLIATDNDAIMERRIAYGVDEAQAAFQPLETECFVDE